MSDLTTRLSGLLAAGALGMLLGACQPSGEDAVDRDDAEAADMSAADDGSGEVSQPDTDSTPDRASADTPDGADGRSSASIARADGPPAYVGTWGRDLAQCDNLQETDAAPLIMTADGSDQYEAHCVFTAVDAVGPDSWIVQQDCSVQGDEVSVIEYMAVEGDTLLQWSDGGTRDEAWRLMRCPG